jgi:hypothetical protein
MNQVPKERVDQMRGEIHAVLGQSPSPMFLKRVDTILEEWAGGGISAAQACEKVQKIVSLFIDEEKARLIGTRCAPIVMRESVPVAK